MRRIALLAAAALILYAKPRKLVPQFQTSDRCLACHNGLTTSSGEDISIGFDWRASMMANSSRDPYWQASVRRESLDHPESQAAIEDECSVCHMPMARFESKGGGREGTVFSDVMRNTRKTEVPSATVTSVVPATEGARTAPFARPFGSGKREDELAEDGVSCSLCHQISKLKLGSRESFNGGFAIDPPDANGERAEYGPFKVEKGHTRIMRSSTGGYRPSDSEHIRQSEMCATCHTLYTKALGAGGKVIGELPEQMPYQEWLHSEFREKQSCQSCHMPVVKEEVRITNVLGEGREGMSRHVFVAANTFMLRMLNRYRNELSVAALPAELALAADRTERFLKTQTARIAIDRMEVRAGRLNADVLVENLGGHKLPTGYPSRRAWLHVVVRDRNQQVVFESGRLKPDGAIEGHDGDEDAARFEPHYAEITGGDQVQTYESVMADQSGAVTTGLLAAVGYVKDNRLLPRGFDKRTAGKDIAVIGEAERDADFTGAGDRVRYSVPLGNSQGPYRVEAELAYQAISYRWANNLKKYDAPEARRFTGYYDAMASDSAVVLVRAVADR